MNESEANLNKKPVNDSKPQGHDQISSDAENETTGSGSDAQSGLPQNSGFTGGAHNKKRQGTEDAQKRSDTGTGL